MKKYIVILICAILPKNANAQINLVLNPQFEQYSVCPDNADEAKYCYNWMSLDSAWNPPDWSHDPNGVPEYCNVCATNIHSDVPINDRFRHYAHSGNGLMQIQMFNMGDSTFPQARDYLQGHLSHVLIAGHTYKVCFYTILGQYSYYCINNIGAYFDNGTIDTTHNPGFVQTQYTPQILDTNIISDTLNWVKIEDTFTANGIEKLITIGNFTDTAHTNTIIAPLSMYATAPASWYQVDDVSVIDCANEPFAGNDTVIHPGDSAWLGPHEELLPYTWYKLSSTTPIDSGGGTMVHPTVTTSYVLKQVLCGITKMDTVKVWVWPDTPTAIASPDPSNRGEQLRFYPNPATGALTIEGAKNCEVVFYDVVGQRVASYLAMTSKEMINIEKLANGVYFVEVVDKGTGEKVVLRLLRASQ